MIDEPRNSWEVSYIMWLKRPKINIGLKKDILWLKYIDSTRQQELVTWAYENYDYKWFKWHI